MSKLKSPQEKKRKSLTKDRRNTYGENDKASRKNIPLAKARSRRDERRSVAQALSAAVTAPEIQAADVVDADVRSTARQKKISGFRKIPDQPLGAVIARKSTRRKLLPD